MAIAGSFSGSETILAVGANSNYSYCIIYMQLDVSVLRGSPQIDSAVLKLKVSDTTSSTSFLVYAVDSEDWNENTITWNQRPKILTDSCLGRYELTDSTGPCLEMDLLDHVVNMASDRYSTVSLAIVAEPNGQWTKFASTRAPEWKPEFTVHYTQGPRNGYPTWSPTDVPTESPTTMAPTRQQNGQLVSLDTKSGKLVYSPYRNEVSRTNSVGNDESLNIIPDFSHAGYKGGGESFDKTVNILVRGAFACILTLHCLV